MNENISSKVIPHVKRRLLFRGVFLGGLGCLLFFYMGVFASLSLIEVWGLPAFFLAMGLIAWGLVPYKKISRLETHPHQVIINDNELLFISTYGAKRVIPFDSVEVLAGKMRYGWLVKKRGKAPTFLPYFLDDPRLNKIVHADESNDFL